MTDDQSSLRPPVRPTPVDQLPKVIDYVLEENSILHEKVRKLEIDKAEALRRIDRLSMALTRIECEATGTPEAEIAKHALYGDPP